MVRPEEGKRISKIDTYLNCAEVFAYRSTIIQAGINNVYLRVGEKVDEYIVIPAMELEWVQKS